MGKRLSIEAYLPLEDLEQRYQAARDGVERSQWPISWSLAGGATIQEVGEVTGYSLPWIRELAQRYNARGADGIGDGRHRHPGHAPLLSAEQQQDLVRVLDGPGPEGGRWSGRRWPPGSPRPRHAKADSAAQEAFKGRSWKQP